jgi:GT2 family glycosyltransferase
VKLADLELRDSICTLERLESYTALRVLARLHGSPIGYVQVPVAAGSVSGPAIGTLIREHHGQALVRHLLSDWLETWPRRSPLSPAALVNVSHPVRRGKLPSVTVAVCTRDRPASLARCLEALKRLDYRGLDILVVDNAPSGPTTERLVRESFSQVRYVQEPRPGLSWARNRAISETQAEIIAFTDDDAVVDPGWVSALADVFVDDANVMAVTGLVVPYELETEAQILFERYGGFGRGFVRRWASSGVSDARWRSYHHTAQFGTGANMAFRRAVFEQVGCFDEALGAGTVTQGGEDLEMIFRVLQEGHALVYEPRALVRHSHRRRYSELRTQVTSNGVGFSAYLVGSVLRYPGEGLAFARLMLQSLRGYFLRRLFVSFLRPVGFPRDLILAELRGRIVCLTRYPMVRI